MQRIDGQLVHTATDLVRFLDCPHRVLLERDAALGRLEVPRHEDPLARHLQERGGAVEKAHVDSIRATGKSVAEAEPPARGRAGLEAAARNTAELIARGVDAIVQPTFFDGTWLGRADVLERIVPAVGPLSHGSPAYEVVDTKLAGAVRASAVVQVMQYSLQLARVQGSMPRAMHLVLGDGRRESIATAHAAAYVRRLKSQYLATIETGTVPSTGPADPMYPWRVPACRFCPWRARCEATREADDHLTLVPGLARTLATRLFSTPLGTRQRLAAATPAQLAATAIAVRVPEPTLARGVLGAGASMEASTGASERVVVVRRPPTRPFRGLWSVPTPTAHDLFVHIEEDPWQAGSRLAFAVGVAGNPDERHVDVINIRDGVDGAGDPLGAERELTSALFRAITESRAETGPDGPPSHVFTFGAATGTALRRLASVHGITDPDFDEWARAGVIVDLERACREGILTGRPYDSLADLDRCAGYVDAGAETVEALTTEPVLATFERCLAGDPDAPEALRSHVRGHLTRLVHLKSKLLEWQAELAAEVGGPEPYVPEVSAASEARAAARMLERERRAALEEIANEADTLAGAARPEKIDDFTAEARAARLLRDLLGWHAREARPKWQEFFGHREMDDPGRLEDTRALGGLSFRGTEPGSARGHEHRSYTFPVGQEHAISSGDLVEVTNWDAGGVQVIAIDNAIGTITLDATIARWGSRPEPEGLAPQGPPNDDVLRQSLGRVAASIIERWRDRQSPQADGTTGPMGGPGSFRAARRLLLADAPRLTGHTTGQALSRVGEASSDAAGRVAREMETGVLAIQGPPGTGKTHTAARMILDALREGQRVGVTAISHKAIGNLVGAVVSAAERSGEEHLVRAVQKGSKAQVVQAPCVSFTDDNARIEARLAESGSGTTNLFAGTPWLFARPAFDEALDVLFVDEAGQVSLANAVAVATSAHRVILLGDPQQLAQPSNGDHPPGAGASALEHLLAGSETMPPERGIFLERSYRMHPAICEYVSTQFYDSRLMPSDGCDVQAVSGITGAGSALGGSGLRFVPVMHTGNRTQSEEEAEAVVRACQAVIGRTWTTPQGSREITVDDVLVVAPYNRQVDLLAARVPGGVRVGTVDRFQGQEAPVVIYSLAASEATDASRGVEFLLDLHRMNVAVSRARGLVVLTCSPRLLSTSCHSIDEIRQVNALCAYVESAVEVGLPVLA